MTIQARVHAAGQGLLAAALPAGRAGLRADFRERAEAHQQDHY